MMRRPKRSIRLVIHDFLHGFRRGIQPSVSSNLRVSDLHYEHLAIAVPKVGACEPERNQGVLREIQKVSRRAMMLKNGQPLQVGKVCPVNDFHRQDELFFLILLDQSEALVLFLWDSSFRTPSPTGELRLAGVPNRHRPAL